MIPAFSPFLALRYLVTRRINLLGIAGVMFAVWAILIVDAVFNGFVSGIWRDVRNGSPDLLVTDLPHDTDYEVLRPVLEAQKDIVVASAPRLRHHGLLQLLRARDDRRSRGSSQIDFDHTVHGFALLLGIDPDREAAVTGLRSWLARGPEELLIHPPYIEMWGSDVLDEPDADRRAQLLARDSDEWAARRRAGLSTEAREQNHRSDMPGVLFGWQRVRRIGRIPRAEPFDLLCAYVDANGTMRSDAVRTQFAGCFATGHRMFDESAVMLPIETLRSLLGQSSFDPTSQAIVTDVALRVVPDLPPMKLTAAKATLQRAVQAVLPAGSPPCNVLDWREQNDVFLRAVAQEQAMMQFALFVVMLVAAFVIYATLHMMVVQKVKDIGILAAIGGSPRGIGGVFLLGGFVVASTGTLLGIGAGLLSVQWLNPINDWLSAHFGIELFPRSLFDLKEIPCDLQPSWIAAVAIGALLLALLVAYVPSRKAARMNPVQALSHE